MGHFVGFAKSSVCYLFPPFLGKGGYVFGSVGLFVLFVCLEAPLLKSYEQIAVW